MVGLVTSENATISPDTGSDITFTYDLTGRRLSMSDGAGSTSYSHDPLGRLTGTSRGGRSVGYAYVWFVVVVSIVLINRPSWLVVPSMRGQPGAIEEWRSKRR